VRARFDFTDTGQAPLVFAEPVEVIRAATVAEVLPACARVEAALAAGRYVAGWVAYEAAPAFDSALVTRPAGTVPLVCFGVFDPPEQAVAPVVTTRLSESWAWTPRIAAAEHATAVAAIREAIAAGDTYQINFTFPLGAEVPRDADLDAVYAELATAAKAPFAAHLDVGDLQVLSLSPELFFRREGRRLVTRPMKGTAPKGRWAAEDEALRDGLRASVKNRAENVMIVDLSRNDMSRVCEWGSVEASSLFEVQPFPTVWQMVSTVEGRLRPDATLTDIFRALFPAGSVTGAPKSSSMRLIAQLESVPRGAYCGAIGYATPDGRAEFSVGIRTITVDMADRRAVYNVGGGITWDSAAGDEYAEAIQKAACLTPQRPVGLIETMRVEGDTVVRLDRHIARMRASASFLGIPFDDPAIRSALVDRIAPADRLRLQLSANGEVAVACTLMDPTPSEPIVVLATSPVSSGDRRLCHKTTDRRVYERRATAHPGAWDVLLWNERDELTEFTRGNVVLEIDGRRLTPRRESGLLNGVFRQELLDRGEIAEAVLTRTDLARATRLWFINSLREWVAVALHTPGPSGPGLPSRVQGSSQAVRPT
jgi:para-aminobenzoate synthetase/4-amino-4-deoxychorismate lyase